MAQNPHKFGSIEYDNWNYEHPQDRSQQVDPVWQAKSALQNPNGLGMFDEANRQKEAAIGAVKHPGALRGLTENAAGFGQLLGMAALPGLVPSPYSPVAGVLGVGANMAMAPDYVRRLIPGLRETGEEAPGMLESAMTVGPAVVAGSKSLLRGGAAALRGLKGLSRGAGLADEAANLGGRALAYEGSPMPMRPWPKPRGASAAAETASELPESWKQFSGELSPEASRFPSSRPTMTPDVPQPPTSGLDYVSDILGPMDSHAVGGPVGTSQRVRTSVPSGGRQSLQGLRGSAATPYTSPEYDAELGRVLRGDAPPFSETGTPVPGPIYHPSNDISGKWGGPGKGYTDLTDDVDSLIGQPHSQGLSNILHQQEAMTDQIDPSRAKDSLAILKRLADKQGGF